MYCGRSSFRISERIKEKEARKYAKDKRIEAKESAKRL